MGNIKVDTYKKFKLKEIVKYGNGGHTDFLVEGSTAILIDYDICEIKSPKDFISYYQITNKQNEYMNQFEYVYRFLAEDKDKIDSFLYSKQTLDNAVKYVADRNESAEVSPLERMFEKNFTDVYGMNSVKYLNREYCLTDNEGNNYFYDYVIHTKHGDFAIEENGVSFHHPQIIGYEKYRKQLRKQNVCVRAGMKLFRFSTEDCEYIDRIEDDIRSFLGSDSSDFIENGLIVNRSVKLYEHQEITLEKIKENRQNGIKAFLIVFPTASGKSKIIEEDLREFCQTRKDINVLIIAPSTNIVMDWKKRVHYSLPDIEKNICIVTMQYMTKHYADYSSNYFNYIVVDEAHHAVAPVTKRVIQYYEPEFLVGLTATDQRPDKKKLESVFGSYNTGLSLKEAMEKEIVARANVYRIETNIDLSHVRFNGKDYINADLEKTIRVSSRNELIADVLKKYFSRGNASKRQGVIFCINVKHAEEMERLLNIAGLSAASYTGKTKEPQKVMDDFKNGKIRFLCACEMISEGWDYPELGILVMARPTLSKVLYLQQIGRGLRRTNTKKNVFVIDVVDEYGAFVKACSMHSIFQNSIYVPFGDIIKNDYQTGDVVEIDGIEERVERIIEVDIESFDSKYSGYLSVEQLARKFFVSTGSVIGWIKKGKIIPTAGFQFGSKMIYMFSPEDAERYRIELDIKEHTDDTIRDDFFEFLEERDYSLSYKMPFLLAFLKYMDSIGDARIDDVLTDYIAFYQDRLNEGLVVDRATCPYNETSLKDIGMIKRSMLTNPFEKFERKRFLYYSKDLGVISMNHALLSRLSEEDVNRIKKQMNSDLENYYRKLQELK